MVCKHLDPILLEEDVRFCELDDEYVSKSICDKCHKFEQTCWVFDIPVENLQQNADGSWSKAQPIEATWRENKVRSFIMKIINEFKKVKHG